MRIFSRSGDKGSRLEQAKDRKTVPYHDAMTIGGSCVCVCMCVCVCVCVCVIGLVEWEDQEKVVEKSIHRSRGSLRNVMSSISNGASVPKIIGVGARINNTERGKQEQSEDSVPGAWGLVC